MVHEAVGDSAALVDCLARSLLGRPCDWDQIDSRNAGHSCVYDEVRYHGVAGLLCENRGSLDTFPSVVADGIRDEAITQAFWEESHRQSLVALVEQFDLGGIDCLFMKGTALAYSLYDPAWLRRRGDTDLLVAQDNLASARQCFAKAGFRRIEGPNLYQEVWSLETAIGLTHTVDLHWQLTNVPAFRRILDVGECFARAVKLPRLHPHARAIDPVLQFLQCCLNQILHRKHGYIFDEQKIYSTSRLIWVYDNHLLLRSFTPSQWDELADFAIARGLGATVLEALELANETFETLVPDAIFRRLRQSSDDEWVAQYLRESGSLAAFAKDLAAVPGWRGRIGLAVERAFPAPERLREKYPTDQNWPVALLYLRRLLGLPLTIVRRAGR